MIGRVLTIGKPRTLNKILRAIDQPQYLIAWKIKTPDGHAIVTRHRGNPLNPNRLPPPGVEVYVGHNGDDPRKEVNTNAATEALA